MKHTAIFSADSLKRHAPEPATVPVTGVLRVMVAGSQIIVTAGEHPRLFLPANLVPAGMTASVEYLGHRGRNPCYAAEIPASISLPEGLACTGVRDLFGRIPDDELAIAAFAVRMIEFARTARFCGRCGTGTERVLTERARRCPVCGLVMYPRLSPAVIVLVQKGDTILLARSPRFPQGVHSLIAGFVEPGETLEHAVHREVQEETGITVTGLRYMASEPWPFPDSLMVAFVADYAGGEIVIDPAEIVSAGWFDRAHLPPLPQRMSLSRALIDWWAGGAGTTGYLQE
jgi:NAD+ diphosphatase